MCSHICLHIQSQVMNEHNFLYTYLYSFRGSIECWAEVMSHVWNHSVEEGENIKRVATIELQSLVHKWNQDGGNKQVWKKIKLVSVFNAKFSPALDSETLTY